MKIKISLSIIVFSFLLIGCSTPEKRLEKLSTRVNKIGEAISLGMTYREVIDRGGRPSYTATNGNVLTVVYRFDPPKSSPSVKNGWLVKLTDGVVTEKSPILKLRATEMPNILSVTAASK